MRLVIAFADDQKNYVFSSAPTNMVFETGDFLATGSNQVITGTASYLFRDAIAFGEFQVVAGTQFFFGGRFKTRNPSKVWAGSGTTGNHRIYEWRNEGTVVGYLRINPTSNVLEVYRAGPPDVLLASSTVTIAALTNYHIEVMVLLSPTAGAIQVRRDGAQIINFSGNTGSVASINRIVLRGPGIQTTDVDTTLGHWFDDFYVNNPDNSNAKGDNTWAGQRRYIARTATGVGTYTFFTPVPPGNANWQNIDDIVDDGETTFNHASTTGLRDSFPIQANGLTNVTFLAVTVRAHARLQGTIPRSIRLGLRQGGQDFTTCALPLSVNFLDYSTRFIKNPLTLVDWSSTTVDSNQVIYEHA